MNETQNTFGKAAQPLVSVGFLENAIGQDDIETCATVLAELYKPTLHELQRPYAEFSAELALPHKDVFPSALSWMKDKDALATLKLMTSMKQKALDVCRGHGYPNSVDMKPAVSFLDSKIFLLLRSGVQFPKDVAIDAYVAYCQSAPAVNGRYDIVKKDLVSLVRSAEEADQIRLIPFIMEQLVMIDPNHDTYFIPSEAVESFGDLKSLLWKAVLCAPPEEALSALAEVERYIGITPPVKEAMKMNLLKIMTQESSAQFSSAQRSPF